jgi:hypothetical protein
VTSSREFTITSASREWGEPMQVKDFPIWLRSLLVATILLFGINAFVFFASVVAIVALLETTPVMTGVVGLVVGAALTYVVTKHLDWGRRQNETKDVTESLYNEIADRAARCLNDHLKPWCGFQTEEFKRSRVAKFRPVEPVVYRAVAAKLGLLPVTTVFWVLRFYYTLDAIDREIDDVIRDFKHDKVIGQDRASLVAQRFRESLRPALEALERLGVGVSNHAEIDREVALVYPWVKETGRPLRSALMAATE